MVVVAIGAPAGAAPRSNAQERLDVYAGVVSVDQLGALVELGIDRHELEIARARGARGAKAQVRVETILSGDQAAELRQEGVDLQPKEIDGRTVAQRATALLADGNEVFRKYSGAGGLKCVVRTVPGFFEDCLLLADDFRQYYLGAFTRTDTANPDSVTGTADPIGGFEGALGGGTNPLDEAGSFQPTGEVLPPDEFPQFTSRSAAEYGVTGSPFAPVEGQRYAGAPHSDSSYIAAVQDGGRAGRRAERRAAVPALDQHRAVLRPRDRRAAACRDRGLGHAAGPERGHATTPPAECTASGFLLAMHPFLRHHLGGADCTAPGTTGTWNSFTGSTGGWDQVAFDLSDYAGQSVELHISCVTDPASGGVGAFVDDTRVVIDGVTDADGFEGSTSSWMPGGPPEGSPPNAGNWQIGEQLVNFFAGTSTEDTLLLFSGEGGIRTLGRG